MTHPIIEHKAQLNDQQAEAFDKVVAFIKNKDKNGSMFSLKGYAGTGKTFTMSRIVEHIENILPRYKIAMTAPTNKAVQVLRESSEVSPKVVFKTIHSLLGLKEVIKESGQIEFEKDPQENERGILSYKIIIVDEVSMLADKLFFELKRYCDQVKIIFMGDPAQIPPVGKEDCEPFLFPEEHKIIEYQLTKIMRQANGSAIVDNSFKIRENLEFDGMRFERGNDVEIFSATEQRPDIAKVFEESFPKGKKVIDVRVIAWTNQKVRDYNTYIRKLIYGEEVARYMDNERLIMNKPFQVEHSDNMDVLTTNQEIDILNLRVKEAFLEGVPVKVYDTRISYINTRGQTKQGNIQIIHEGSEKLLNNALEEIKHKAITGPQQDRKQTWALYYRLLRSVADVAYSYAITAHKSQGSTYKTAIVDVRNIAMNQRVVERNRILYTSITRAKSKLYLIK